MYKAMIIDDEEIVRWGIRDLIDWEAEGFALCEDGHDGRDGLHKLLKHTPDLVLVDIKMPGLNGIELIRTAREAGFEGRFIILTGYSEFEFAKAAISLGVDEYLLKPVDEEELALIARKIKKELDLQAQESLRHRADAEATREELLRRVLLRMGTKEELQKQMAEYGISFGEDILCAAILTDTGTNGEDAEKYARKCDGFLKESALYLYKTTMEGRVVLISRGTDHKSWARMLSSRNERLRTMEGEGLVIAVGNNVGNWYDLSYSYKFAKSMLEQEFLLGRVDVLSIGAIEEQ